MYRTAKLRPVFVVFLLLFIQQIAYARPISQAEWLESDDLQLAFELYSSIRSIFSDPDALTVKQLPHSPPVYAYNGTRVFDNRLQYNLQITADSDNKLQEIIFRLEDGVTLSIRVFWKNGERWLATHNNITNSEAQMPFRALLQTPEARGRIRRAAPQHPTPISPTTNHLGYLPAGETIVFITLAGGAAIGFMILAYQRGVVAGRRQGLEAAYKTDMLGVKRIAILISQAMPHDLQIRQIPGRVHALIASIVYHFFNPYAPKGHDRVELQVASIRSSVQTGIGTLFEQGLINERNYFKDDEAKDGFFNKLMGLTVETMYSLLRASVSFTRANLPDKKNYPQIAQELINLFSQKCFDGYGVSNENTYVKPDTGPEITDQTETFDHIL